MSEERKFVRPGLQQVTSDKYGRFYSWGGDRFFSVTTILSGGLPKPALINWAKKFTAEYAIEHYGMLGQLIEDDPKGALDWLKGAAYRDRDKKADLGSLVHDYAEAHALGKPMPEAPDDVQPILAQFNEFLEAYKPRFIAVEAPVFSRKEKYAGTLDAIADFDIDLYGDKALGVILGGLDMDDLAERIAELRERGTIRLLLDWKSGKGIYPEVALQLAAYRYADTFLGMPDGSEAPMPAVDGAITVHLRPDKWGVYPVMTDDTIYRTFLYTREVFRFGRDYQKLVLGDSQN